MTGPARPAGEPADGPLEGPRVRPGPEPQATAARPPRGPDLRLLPVAAAAELGALGGVALDGAARVALLAVGCLLVSAVLAGVLARELRVRRAGTGRVGPPRPPGSRALAAVGSASLLGVLVVWASATGIGALAHHRRDAGPVAALGASGGSGRVEAVVGAVPRPVTGGGQPGAVLLDTRVTSLRVGGRTVLVDVPVTALADRSWARLGPGTRVSATFRFRPRRGVSSDAAFAVVRGPPTVLGLPGGLRAATGRVRAGLARVSAPLGQPASGLLPAVVHGDTSGVPAEVTEQFRVSGLAHLQAVSGANVAVVVVAATAVTVALGGGRLVSTAVGLAAVAGFAVLADLSPPVVRAGGTAVLVLLGARAAPGRGPALLATAVTVLLLVDPWLAADVGFALSVSATAGILAAGSRFGAALATWLPGPVATAAGIGLAAQSACQPLLTAISGQVGLVAPFTNLAAEPAVAVATLSGVLAALLATVGGPLGTVAALGAAAAAEVGGLACRWLATVARVGAAAPGATAGWSATGPGVAAAVLLTAAVLAAGPSVLRHRRVAIAVAGALAGLVAGPLVLR